MRPSELKGSYPEWEVMAQLIRRGQISDDNRGGSRMELCPQCNKEWPDGTDACPEDGAQLVKDEPIWEFVYETLIKRRTEQSRQE